MLMETDNEKIVVLEKYDTAVEASIVAGMLQSNGVAAGVIGASTATALTMARVAVVVFERDLEEARALLDEKPVAEEE